MAGQERTAVPGGRLVEFQEAWRRMLGSKPIQQVVRQGHRIAFSRVPPLSQPGDAKETRWDRDRMTAIRTEVRDLVRKKAVRKVSWQEAMKKPGYYSRMFCVSKADGSKRPIINLRPMNRFVRKEKFKMETVQNVRELLRPGLWGATIDLRDAFYHVNVHRKSRKFLRFILDGQVYEYTALPMGLTCSPRVFTSLNKAVGVVFRRQGITCVFYIDDILVTGETEEDCRNKVLFVLQSLRGLGFLINSEKSVLQPSRRFLYLGMWWDTENWTVSLAVKRETGLRSLAAKLRTRDYSTCRQVASMIGRVQSATVAVPLARARIRQTQWEFLASCTSKADYNTHMCLSMEAREELEFWENLIPSTCCPISLPKATQTLLTDASSFGLGGYINGHVFSEEAPSGHINFTELVGLDRALDHFWDQGLVEPGPLVWRVDNVTAQASILKQGSTRNWEINVLAVRILLKAETRNIQLMPARISSEDNFLADQASRFEAIADWALNQSVVSRMCSR